MMAEPRVMQAVPLPPAQHSPHSALLVSFPVACTAHIRNSTGFETRKRYLPTKARRQLVLFRTFCFTTLVQAFLRYRPTHLCRVVEPEACPSTVRTRGAQWWITRYLRCSLVLRQTKLCRAQYCRRPPWVWVSAMREVLPEEASSSEEEDIRDDDLDEAAGVGPGRLIYSTGSGSDEGSSGEPEASGSGEEDLPSEDDGGSSGGGGGGRSGASMVSESSGGDGDSKLSEGQLGGADLDQHSPTPSSQMLAGAYVPLRDRCDLTSAA